MPILKVISGGARNAGRRYVIDRDQIYIGRDPGNDIVVQDVGVTGYHARVLRTEYGYLLIEERTSTGIWVEDRKVSNLFLQHGTRFRLGGTAFMFDAELSDTLMLPPDPAAAPAPSPASLLATVPGVIRPEEIPAPPPTPPSPAPPAPAPPPSPAGAEPPANADAPAWASSGHEDLQGQLALPVGSLTGRELSMRSLTCPGCEAPLVGMERFCAICGTRSKYGGRRRVMLLKVIALLLVLASGSVGFYTLTGGDVSRNGLRKAIDLVLGDRTPSWLKL